MANELFNMCIVFGIIGLFLGVSISSAVFIDDDVANQTGCPEVLDGFLHLKNDCWDHVNPEDVDLSACSDLVFTKNMGQLPDEILFQTQVDGATVYPYRDTMVSMFNTPFDRYDEVFNHSIGDPSQKEIFTMPQYNSSYLVNTIVNADTNLEVRGQSKFSLCNNYFFSNPPDEEWNTTFGWIGDDVGLSTVQAPDGGYVTAGTTCSYDTEDTDALLMKVNGTGDLVWSRTFGGDESDVVMTVRTCSDGGFILVGNTNSFSDDFIDIWIIKTDPDGYEEWNKTINWDHDNEERVMKASPTNEGGVVITGLTKTFNTDDLFLVKANSNGECEWFKIFKKDLCWEAGNDVVQTDDDGYIIAGTCNFCPENPGVGPDIWLIKTDPDGYEEWNKTYDGEKYDYPTSVIQTNGGGYVISGVQNFSVETFGDIWFFKTDDTGDREWDHIFTSPNGNLAYSVIQTKDNGFALVGAKDFTSSGGGDLYIIGTDNNGNAQWEKTMGKSGENSEIGSSMIQTDDGGYFIAGSTTSYGAGNQDVWLIKLRGQMSNGEIIYVDDDAPAGWYDSTHVHTIKEGVDTVHEGGTVRVYEGSYTENVVIDKSDITIKGNGSEHTTIVAADSYDDAVRINNCDNVTFQKFKVTGVTGDTNAGVVMGYANNCAISDLNCNNNYNGIGVIFSSEIVLKNNICSDSSWGGIGIVSSSKNIIKDNICNNNPLCGISFLYSYDNIIKNNVCSDHTGIWLMETSNNLVTDNNCNNCDGSIYLHNSSGETIKNNTCSDNHITGIFIYNSSDNNVTGNSFCNNMHSGIYLLNSSSNLIFLNNFIGNGDNVNSTNSNNSWNSTEKITYTYEDEMYTNYLGNYWDDYIGTDNNSDGIGDIPYSIPGGSNQDSYPLMEPWGNYPPQFPDLTLSSDDITFSNPIPDDGETVTITATIHNNGNVASNDVTVQFFDGNPNNGGIQIGVDKTIDTIDKESTVAVNVNWIASSGSHEIYVVVNYDDEESDENNNIAFKLIMVGCDQEFIQKAQLLYDLNYFSHYDFYEYFHEDWDNNGTGPEPVKDPNVDTCVIPTDNDDIWIVRFSENAPGFYPCFVALMGPEIGFDTNTWYDGTFVFDDGRNFPEFIIDSVPDWLDCFPWLGEDIEELLGQLLNAARFSINLSGVYAEAPMQWDDEDQEAWISMTTSGGAIGPGVEEGLDVQVTMSKICDSNLNITDELTDVLVSLGLGIEELQDRQFGFSKEHYWQEDIWGIGEVEVGANVTMQITFSPAANIGGRIRVAEPEAMVLGLEGELSINVEATANVTVKCENLGIDIEEEISLPTPSLYDPAGGPGTPISMMGEGLLAYKDFDPGETIDAIYDSYEYENLNAGMPVIRIGISGVALEYTLCIDLREYIPISPFEEVCLFDDILFETDPWEYLWEYTGFEFNCPVDVHVYDTQGRHVGPDGTGGIDREIPYSNYIINGDKKRILLPPGVDKFVLIVEGTDEGTYDMNMHTAMLVSNSTGFPLIEGVDYEVNGAPTEVGSLDYYGFDLNKLGRDINDRVQNGESVEDAIATELDSIICEYGITKQPTGLFVSDAFGARGNQVLLNGRLMYLDSPLANATVVFNVDGVAVGSTMTDSNGNATFVYTVDTNLTPEIYEISVIYSGDDMYTGSAGIARLTVINQPPVADANGPYIGVVDAPITFVGSGCYDPDGEIISWGWTFDGGNTESGETVTHTYSTAGYYKVTLTVTDNDGSMNKDEAYVIIDSSSPITSKTIAGPTYGPNDEWVTSKAEFNLTATDDLSGVDKIYYRIWHEGIWNPQPGTGEGIDNNFTEYTENFTLSDEGKHYIEFYSLDNAGNVEDVHNQTHVVVNDSEPYFYSEIPVNDADGISRPPLLQISLWFHSGDYMDVFFEWKNHTGKWICLELYDGVGTGTYSSNTSCNAWLWGNTTYTWSVNVTDGIFWTNQTFTFTTGGSRYDVNNDDKVNFIDAGIVWVHRTTNAVYDGLYDVNQDATVNFIDAGKTWVNRD